MGKPVYATTDAYIDPAVRLRRGEIWDDQDAIVLQHPDQFTDDPYAHGLVRHSGVEPVRSDAVETATAAPGEKRTRSSSTRG